VILLRVIGRQVEHDRNVELFLDRFDPLAPANKTSLAGRGIGRGEIGHANEYKPQVKGH
jgi:hypothetical protein